MTPGWRDFPTRAAADAALADEVAASLRAAWQQRGRASLGIPGGTTPAGFLSALAEHDLPWAALSTILVDERLVPVNDKDRNEPAARSALAKALARGLTLVPLAADTPILTEAAAFAQAAYAGLGGPLDCIVLGVGEDGHFASLFPGRPALDDTGTVIIETDAPKPPPSRVSLSLPTLAAAGTAFVLAFGTAKRDAVEAGLTTAQSPLACLNALRPDGLRLFWSG